MTNVGGTLTAAFTLQIHVYMRYPLGQADWITSPASRPSTQNDFRRPRHAHFRVEMKQEHAQDLNIRSRDDRLRDDGGAS